MLRRIYNHVAPGRRAGAAGLTEMTATFNSVPMAPLPDGPFAGRTVKPFTEMEPNVTTPYNPMEYNDYLVLDSWSIGPDTVILRLAFPDSAKDDAWGSSITPRWRTPPNLLRSVTRECHSIAC